MDIRLEDHQRHILTSRPQLNTSSVKDTAFKSTMPPSWSQNPYMDRIVMAVIEIEPHPYNVNTEGGFCLSKSWKPLICSLKLSGLSISSARLCGPYTLDSPCSKVIENTSSEATVIPQPLAVLSFNVPPEPLIYDSYLLEYTLYNPSPCSSTNLPCVPSPSLFLIHLVFLRKALQLLVTAKVRSSLNPSTLMMEATYSSESLGLRRSTRRHISEDGILHSYRREDFKFSTP
jgi:hypothetical protein